MGTFRKIVRKAAFSLLLTAMFAAALAAAGCENNLEDGISAENIEFPLIDPTWTQTEVVSKTRLALSQLSTQSQTIRSLYSDWEISLRQELSASRSDYYDILAQIGFASFVQDTQEDISYICQRVYNVTMIKYYVEMYIADLVAAISDLCEDQDAAALFEARVYAFQMIHYLNQREFYLNLAEKTDIEADFAELCSVIEELGGGRVPQGSAFVTIVTLQQQLRRSLPSACGEDRYNFIQQFEDFAQFDAWTDDLSALSYDLTIPRW